MSRLVEYWELPIVMGVNECDWLINLNYESNNNNCIRI